MIQEWFKNDLRAIEGVLHQYYLMKKISDSSLWRELANDIPGTPKVKFLAFRLETLCI